MLTRAMANSQNDAAPGEEGRVATTLFSDTPAGNGQASRSALGRDLGFRPLHFDPRE